MATLGMAEYIWQQQGWPRFTWDSAVILPALGKTRQAQGRLLGRMSEFGLVLQAEVLVEDAFTTAAIEGEKLDRDSVRSSVARRLGLSTAGLSSTERRVDGLVEMLVDATKNHDQPLTAARLKGWQAALFPTGYAGMKKIAVARWRTGGNPMQVVSGPIGREKVHFEAPPAGRLAAEMKRFLGWFNDPPAKLEGLVRAAVAHLWLVTIHPFEDGNGRVGRAVADMALAQDEGTGVRCYSMSAQIGAERENYYNILERTQKRDGDITAWVVWFLVCLERAMRRSEYQVEQAFAKARFWQRWSSLDLNRRQRKVVNRLLDAGPGGFVGGLTNRKYRAMSATTRETAKRDIAVLVEKGILVRNPGGGRSASYELAW